MLRATNYQKKLWKFPFQPICLSQGSVDSGKAVWSAALIHRGLGNECVTYVLALWAFEYCPEIGVWLVCFRPKYFVTQDKNIDLTQ